MNGGEGDRRDRDLPWASMFDPAANVRALSSIQAEGFRAASELVDRFVKLAASGVDGAGPASGNGSPRGAEQHSESYGATDVDPLIRSWWAMVGQFLMGHPRQTPDRAPTAPAALHFAATDTDSRLDIDVVAGQSATAEVWLHNAADEDRGRVRLRCGELMAADGATIKAAAVGFDPRQVPVPPRSSRGVAVTVKAGKDVRPGLYRGTLLVEGQPALWLPLLVTVRPPHS